MTAKELDDTDWPRDTRNHALHCYSTRAWAPLVGAHAQEVKYGAVELLRPLDLWAVADVGEDAQLRALDTGGNRLAMPDGDERVSVAVDDERRRFDLAEMRE